MKIAFRIIFVSCLISPFAQLYAMAATIPPLNFHLATQLSSESVTQYGITWKFSSQVKYGQFVNGDYYVLDQGNGVRIVNISPGATLVDGRTINGSMVNPPYNAQGYDSLRNYTDSLNVGKGISESTPLILKAGDSLVSSISLNPHPGGNNSYLQTAAVLTCLNVSPPAGTFRPGYSDPEKTLHNLSSVNYSLLKTLPKPASAPHIAGHETKFQRVWLDHLVNYANRMLHPSENMPNYGRDIARLVGDGALLLQLDYSNVEKEKLLINYIQVGIDLFGIVKSGGIKNWINNGGHESGRKWPILFAGIMLNDNSMKNIGVKSGDYLLEGSFGEPPIDYIHFGEDDQTFYVTQQDVDCSHNIGCTWSPDSRAGIPYPYTNEMIGMPEWGIKQSNQPSISNSAWSAIYRPLNSYVWGGFILSARMMDAEELWNKPALFDYVDRYMAIAQGQADPFGYSVVGQDSSPKFMSTFMVDMWNTHRNDY